MGRIRQIDNAGRRTTGGRFARRVVNLVNGSKQETRGPMKSDNWAQWSKFEQNGGTITYGGTGNDELIASGPAGARAFVTGYFNVKAGRCYVVTFDMLQTGNNINDTKQFVSGVAIAAGTDHISLTSIPGRWGFRFQASADGIMTFRLGAGTTTGLVNATTVRLKHPMVEEIDNLTDNFSPWIRDETAAITRGMNLRFGQDVQQVIAADNTSDIDGPITGYSHMIAIGDSFANDVYDWPQVLPEYLPAAVNGYGWSGGKLTNEIASLWKSEIATGRGWTGAVIQGGVNDLSSQTATAMMNAVDTMVRQGKSAGIHDYAMVNISPFGASATWTAWKQNTARRYNEMLENYCLEHGFAYVDIYSPLDDAATPGTMTAAYDSGDGLHPNQAGMALIAQTIAREIIDRASR